MPATPPVRTPIIGIACDVTEPKPGRLRAGAAVDYALCVERAGGTPVLLPPIVSCIPRYLQACHGFVLIGGDDPRMEAFGKVTHPEAVTMHPVRQEFDTRFIRTLLQREDVPVLGVCLGMQLMALLSGGDLHQHLPDVIATADRHAGGVMHSVRVSPDAQLLSPSDTLVNSYHHQAVCDAGSLRVVATSDDGVIEAIERPSGACCLGVQWHPERSGDGALGQGLFDQLVSACTSRA